MDPSTSLGTEQCSHRISAAVSPACNGVWIVGSGVDVKHILRSLSCRRVLSRALSTGTLVPSLVPSSDGSVALDW